MKIVFLAAADNYHTKKWCEYFSKKGHEVHVVSFIDALIDNVDVHFIDCGVKPIDSDIKKIKYLTAIKKIKKVVKTINPDIINAHYATSYGMIAAVCGFKNYILSLWGMDVYEFPNKSFLHRMYFKYLINKAPHIFSTSKVMAKETSKYTKKEIHITPFGVNTTLFSPDKRIKKDNDRFVVGIIKALKKVYGIDVLIRACKLINDNRSDINLELRIAGKGEKEQEYKKLAEELNVKVKWLGFISQEEVANEWANMDLGVIPSLEESFGVSAIEAEACGIPLIVSDAPGLLESTVPGETSVVVERNNVEKLANAIIELHDNKKKMAKMGEKGRNFVVSNFEYNKCFKDIEKLFVEFSKNK